MKKQDLYSLIEKRYVAKKKEIRDRYEAQAEKTALGLYEKFEDNFKNLADQVEKVKKASGFSFNSLLQYDGYTSNILNIASKGRLDEHVKKQLIQEFKFLRKIMVYDHLDDSIKDYRKAHNQMVVKYEAEVEQAETLKNELNNVVRISSTAKQAAKKLEELGLDLSDLEEVMAQTLPAVIKTSVDVCLFNKQGC